MRNIQPPEYSGLDSNREALDWMARGDAFYARYARWLYVVDGKLNAVFFVFFFSVGFYPPKTFTFSRFSVAENRPKPGIDSMFFGRFFLFPPPQADNA